METPRPASCAERADYVPLTSVKGHSFFKKHRKWAGGIQSCRFVATESTQQYDSLNILLLLGTFQSTSSIF